MTVMFTWSWFAYFCGVATPILALFVLAAYAAAKDKREREGGR